MDEAIHAMVLRGHGGGQGRPRCAAWHGCQRAAPSPSGQEPLSVSRPAPIIEPPNFDDQVSVPPVITSQNREAWSKLGDIAKNIHSEIEGYLGGHERQDRPELSHSTDLSSATLPCQSTSSGQGIRGSGLSRWPSRPFLCPLTLRCCHM